MLSALKSTIIEFVQFDNVVCIYYVKQRVETCFIHLKW